VNTDVKSYSFVDYHEQVLPELLASGRDALIRGQRLPTLGISVAGELQSFTYQVTDSGLCIAPGVAQAEVSVELSHDDWRGMVADLETVPGILYGNRLVSHTGDLMGFARWEPALRALYTGRQLYDPVNFELKDQAGQALDPTTQFETHSDPAQMKRFLEAAGYLLVSQVFDKGELDTFRAAATEMASNAVEGDQQSWWGKRAEGENVLCRCLNAGSHPAYEKLYDDPRLEHLAKLLPEGMQHPAPADQDAITVIFKNFGVSEGLSDLPWHRDCGMGGHATMCPTYVVSIYLYDATPAQGALHFLPGSHRYAYGFSDALPDALPAAVAVGARAGDITVHIGDVMHAAPPPQTDVSPFRQSVLLSYHPAFANHRGERHYNDALLGAEDGQVSHMTDMIED
jgi:ectoine hydroxylase-related dioxygenase (phytanoyl-CoA dioxygenase family)